MCGNLTDLACSLDPADFIDVKVDEMALHAFLYYSFFSDHNQNQVERTGMILGSTCVCVPSCTRHKKAHSHSLTHIHTVQNLRVRGFAPEEEKEEEGQHARSWPHAIIAN